MAIVTEIADDQSAGPTTTQQSSKNASVLREEGNKCFKEGKLDEAAELYVKSVRLKSQTDNDKLAAYKNLAAVYLKQEKFDQALEACDSALEIGPHDVKALFRRCQSLEGLERYGDALRDGLKVQHMEPQNQAIRPLLERINIKLRSKAKEQSTTVNRVTSMFNIVNDTAADDEKREQAVENLIVLARESAGANLIVENDGIRLLKTVIESNLKNNHQIALSAIRVVSELCRKSVTRTRDFLTYDGIEFLLCTMQCLKQEELITAVQYTIQMMLSALSGFDIREGKTSDRLMLKENAQEIDQVMQILLKSVTRRIMTGKARDALIEIIMRNVEQLALDWASKVVDLELLEPLLETASELEEVKYESSMEITCNTRTHIAVTLDRIYTNCSSDASREKYRNDVMRYLGTLLKTPDIEPKVRATAVITTLLQGPTEVGNHCLSQQGLVEMMLVMAGAEDDPVQQKVAAEAIIAAASKKDKCASIVSMGTEILKKLYQSPDEAIKVRGLVGLCKLGSAGGTDAAVKPFSEKSVHKLVAACRRFLISSGKSDDLKKWAAEGFAYLTLDADVKEEIADDPAVIKALIDLGKSGNLSCLYGIITTLVNLTNSYDKNEILPEMIELAKFAKQHIPEEHVKDKKDYVDQRVKKLADMDVAAALTGLSKTESQSARELIARVFNAICENKEHRGKVVSSGGVKALLDLALHNNTPKGQQNASQALARIGITMNPDVAFPGQRAVEVVRPIMQLLHVECTALQNFEALMALTNLAQHSESVRNRLFNDCGLSKIENYMYEDHVLLRRAATQCISNMITHKHAIEAHEGPNDRVKMLLVLSEEDDLETVKAASGALAMLTSLSKIACAKVFEPKRWFEILLMLCSSKDKELQHRGIAIVRNVMAADKELAERIVQTPIFEVLMAVVRPEVDDISEKVKSIAQEALEVAKAHNLIKNTPDAVDSDDEPD